ncbi:uncharacterized protein (DUF1810 family) [Frigoribacterium sp. PvP120]|jgi:uncharacterized protein (DUF1810 family)|uniref:DUF1810 domain-containing protein n=1 Tax=unclassified Frigoribacterium TaxID=2627005 RepID=UPI001AEAF025|nr:DUF1810 domain-containing protein [Frigoribacterium sp. PvP121]MBP1240060.1 uncharacterized protein (DUF1810 family) [Frigoribacterium sp. PvP121]
MTDHSELLARHDLERFVDAQEADGTFDRALRELRNGNKRTHWMWFVFPQAAGLGTSETSRRYAIGSIGEARAYLAHPLLGPRLLDSVDALLELPGDDAVAVLGDVDATKLRSSLTLFAQADPSERRFSDALAKFFDGQLDPATLEHL